MTAVVLRYVRTIPLGALIGLSPRMDYTKALCRYVRSSTRRRNRRQSLCR